MTSIVPSTWAVPEIFRQRLGTSIGRQRLMEHDGHLLLILHEVPQPGAPERRGLLFWRDPQGRWETDGRGPGLAALEALVGRYAARVDALEHDFGGADTAQALFPVLRAITPLVRAAKHVHQVLQSAREAVREDRDIIDLRDRAEELLRAAELLDTEARTALEFDIAESAEAQAKLNQQLAMTGQRLNLLAAMFLPLTAIASVFGMNLPSGLDGVGSPLLFWVVLVVGIGVGLVVRGRLVPTASINR